MAQIEQPLAPARLSGFRANLFWILPAAVSWGFLGWLLFVELPHVARIFDQAHATKPGMVRLLLQFRFWFAGALAVLVGLACWSARRSSQQFCILMTPALVIILLFSVVHQPISSWLENLKRDDSEPIEVAPRVVIEKAIAAHGGRQQLKQILTGSYRLRLQSDSQKHVPGANRVTWKNFADSSAMIEETFELPIRCFRRVTANERGKKIFVEFATTNGNGWMRNFEGKVKDLNGPPLSLDKFWQCQLAILPYLLEENCQLETVGVEKVGTNMAPASASSTVLTNPLRCFSSIKNLGCCSRQNVDSSCPCSTNR